MKESPTPVVERTATPATVPVSDKGTATEKVSQSRDIVPEAVMETTETNQDTFTSMDAKSLSPELKVKYDAMLTDYKKKTTEVAQQIKEAEAKLKEAQEVLQNPDFQRAYTQMTSQQQSV